HRPAQRSRHAAGVFKAELANLVDLEQSAQLGADLLFAHPRRALPLRLLVGVAAERQVTCAGPRDVLQGREVAGQIDPPAAVIATAVEDELKGLQPGPEV